MLRCFVLLEFRLHRFQEATGEHQEDAAIPFSSGGPFIHGDVMIAGDEYAFAFSHVYLFFAIIKQHFSRINVIYGVFARAVDASAGIVVEKTEENVIVVEYHFHRAGKVFRLVLSFHVIVFLNVRKKPT